MRKPAQGVRKGPGGLLLEFIVRTLVHLAYIAGLTILVPVGFLLLSPLPDQAVAGFLMNYFLVGAGLVVGSVIFLLWWKASLSRTLLSLGMMTLVPGILALLLSVYDRDILRSWLLANVPNYTLVQPYVAEYIDRAVPKIWWLTLAYVILGFLLMAWGARTGRSEMRGRWFSMMFRR